MEVEDDVFFADLSKQIALLIMDDDDEFPVKCPPVPNQGFQCMPQAMMPAPYTYELAYRRESKGTGVFIPRSSGPRRKGKPNRSTPNNSSSNNSHRQQLHRSEAVSRGASDGRLYSSCYANSGVRQKPA